MTTTTRQPIDTLRCLACILLVIYHVVGYDETIGLKIKSGLIRDINDLLRYIRMPLFTFLSGVVYAYRPYNGNLTQFINGKFRRLIVPMFVVGTLFAFIQAVIPGTNAPITNWSLLHIIPVGHFWFVESLFLIFMLLIPLEVLKIFNTANRFLMVFIAACVIHVHWESPPIWLSLAGAVYLLPYFLLGMGICRYAKADFDHQKAAWLLLGLVFIMLYLIYIGSIPIANKHTLASLFISASACIALYYLNLKIPLLARIGGLSYSIYLYHVFFTAGVRIVLLKLNIDSIVTIFVLSFLSGIFGPIGVDLLLRKHKMTRLLFLGRT